MAGRASQIDQAAAMTRVVQIATHAPAFRQHLHEVTSSSAFKGSRRSQDFLNYIVEKALTGQFDALKERSIGVEIFGRDPSYDTGEDAIVRVTASDVRRRLQQFYGHTHPEWRIDLPAGSYIPEFHRVEPAPELTVEDRGVESVSAPAGVRSWWYYAAAALLCCALAAWAWAERRGTPNPKAARVLPWSLILQNDRDVRILLCDPDISAMQRLLNFNISLSDYANKQFIPEALSSLAQTRELASYLRGANVAAVDAALTLTISELLGHSKHVKTQPARGIQVSDLKTDDNLIVLGSPRSNPWFKYFEKPLHFRFEYNAADRQEVIVNSNVRSGELERYVPTAMGWGTGQAYGTVAFVSSPHQTSKVLLLAGTNAEATEAAGKLATNLDLLAQTLRKHGMDQADVHSFQILLQVGTMAGSSNAFEVIACHRLND